MILEDIQKEIAIETLTEYINILNKENQDKKQRKINNEIKQIQEIRNSIMTKNSKEICDIINTYNKKIKKYYFN